MTANESPPESRIGDDIHVDLAGRMTYGDYLQLNTLLAAKKPLTNKHDEHLFITIHHVQELWLNLMAHELNSAIANIEQDQLPPAFKSMARMTRILEQMITAWNVLSTMTPSDYLEFRSELGQSSGLQSYQYRLVEFRMGAKDAKMLLPHRHDAEVHARLKAALDAPGLYDVSLMLLKRRGFDIPDSVTERDYSVRHVASDAVRDAWLKVYRELKEILRLVRIGRRAGRSGRLVPAMAVPSHEDGGAHHRLQARHRRFERSRLPEIGPRPFFFPGALGGKDRTVTFGGTPVR